jgi:uncharacterized protein YkwD
MKKIGMLRSAFLFLLMCLMSAIITGVALAAPGNGYYNVGTYYWPDTWYQSMVWPGSSYQTTVPPSGGYQEANASGYYVQYVPVTVDFGGNNGYYQATVAAKQPTPTPAPSNNGNVTADQQKAISLMNADRAAYGLPPLGIDSKLVALAQSYAQDMVNRNFFSHTNPEGQSPFDRMQAAGISYQYAGENIAINTSVSGAENAFMNSPGHRANILDANYDKVGIGVVHAADGMVYVAQEFVGD